MVKIFRRIIAGQHPEAEMSGYLTAQGFSNAPPLLGDVVQVATDGTPHTLAVALGFVRNQGDAWSWMLDQLTRALDSLSPEPQGCGVRPVERLRGGRRGDRPSAR